MVFSLADPDAVQVLADGTTITGIERLELTGSGMGDTVTGGALADVLHESGGSDRLDGAGGNDTFYGSLGDDTLLGGDGDDSFFYQPYGSTAALDADQIDGGAGADDLHMDYWGVLDETGHQPQITLSIADPTILQTLSNGTTIIGIEKLWLMGNDATSRIGGGDLRDWVRANEGADTVYGGGGRDTLLGEDGNGSYRFPEQEAVDGDRLFGGHGGDQIFGDAGTDFLKGGQGDDLIHGGTNNDQIFGGLGQDMLYGDEGDDEIWAGAGPNTLTGGSGADSFCFANAPVAGQADSITDFASGQDHIRLISAGFGNMAIGALADADFALGVTAADSTDRIIYDQTTGTIWYDGDGSGDQLAGVLAILMPGSALAAADILIG